MDGVRRELERIYKRDGVLTASTVLAEAESEMSALHSYFEWDDDAAAHSFRLIQARTLIRKVRVISPAGTEEVIIHVPSISRGEGEYQLRSVVVGQPDAYERAMKEALSNLSAAKTAVDELRSIKPNRRLTDASKLVDRAQKIVEEVRPES